MKKSYTGTGNYRYEVVKKIQIVVRNILDPDSDPEQDPD